MCEGTSESMHMHVSTHAGLRDSVCSLSFGSNAEVVQVLGTIQCPPHPSFHVWVQVLAQLLPGLSSWTICLISLGPICPFLKMGIIVLTFNRWSILSELLIYAKQSGPSTKVTNLLSHLE